MSAAEATVPPPPQKVLAGKIPLATLRGLYLDRTVNTAAQHAAADEYLAVKYLSPLRKKRILVTGVGSPHGGERGGC